MSSQAIGNIVPPPAAYPPPVEEEAAPRSFARQVMHDTFINWRARMGAVWIGVLGLAAVLAPFLANSHPYLLKMNGQWSSPLLRHLTPMDVLLLIMGASAMVLLPLRRFAASQKTGLLVWILAAALPMVAWPAVASGWAPGIDVLRPTMALALLLLLLALDVTALILIPIRLSISIAHWLVLVALAAIVAGGLILFPVAPPQTVVYDRYRQAQSEGQIQYLLRAPIPFSPTDRLRDQPELRLTPPSRQHWLGTEVNGADVLSRMIHASRIALAIGFISTGIAMTIGVLIGGLMGFFVGRVDIVGMRLVEIFEAIPTLFLLITFVAFFGRNLYIMMVIIGLVGWTGYARFIRAEFLRLRKQDFVHAAIAAGLPLRSVLFRHMLPNGITPVLVAASFGVASAILYEATLSFLGLGLVDEPSWGQMLEQARSVGGTFTWWMAVFPGLAIFLTVFAYNLVGESFRDAIDPRIRKE